MQVEKSPGPHNPKQTAATASLARSQARFSAALIETDLPTPEDVIGPLSGKKADKRFSIYRNNVLVSLTESLMASFPSVVQLVGEEFFRAMARLFIAQTPPKSAMLATYGAEFSAFLKGFEPVAELPYLADVAALDFTWLQAYHAADMPPLDPTALQSVDPSVLGDLTFRFHPACHLIAARHAAYSIWAAHKGDDPAHAMAHLVDRPEDILITRPRWDVIVVSLPPGGLAFAQRLLEGDSLSQAAETAVRHHPDFDFAQNLGGLLETGALASLHLPQPTGP